MICISLIFMKILESGDDLYIVNVYAATPSDLITNFEPKLMKGVCGPIDTYKYYKLYVSLY